MWESSGRSWKDSAFGLWSTEEEEDHSKGTKNVFNRFTKEKFQIENAKPIKGQEVHRTPDYFESMYFFSKLLLLQTQGYGQVLKVLFGHFWTQKSSDTDGLVSKVTVFKDEAPGKWLAREDSDFINELIHDRLRIWWCCWEMAEGSRWDIAEGSREREVFLWRVACPWPFVPTSICLMAAISYHKLTVLLCCALPLSHFCPSLAKGQGAI